MPHSAVQHRLAAHSLIETMVAVLIASCALSAGLAGLHTTMRAYLKINQMFNMAHSKAILRHYIQQDLRLPHATILNCNKFGLQCQPYNIDMSHIIPKHVKAPRSNILVIYSPTQTILYYLRQSVLTKNVPIYALYRDDIVHNAQALVEGIATFDLQFIDQDALVWLLCARFDFVEQNWEMQWLVSKPKPVIF